LTKKDDFVKNYPLLAKQDDPNMYLIYVDRINLQDF